jgi:hypothetical protein
VSAPRVRFRIWWLMVATAIIALLLARLGAVVGLALICMLIVIAVPVAWSPAKLRLVVAAWALPNGFPLLIRLAHGWRLTSR